MENSHFYRTALYNMETGSKAEVATLLDSIDRAPDSTPVRILAASSQVSSTEAKSFQPYNGHGTGSFIWELFATLAGG